MKGIAALLFCLVAGCSSAMPVYHWTDKQMYSGPVVREIPIWLDKNFDQIDDISISEAIATWQYALNGYIDLRIVDAKFNMEVSKINEQAKRDGWLILKIGTNSKMIPEHGSHYQAIAFADYINGNKIFVISSRMPFSMVKGTIMHEIGHLLGAVHSKDGLMYPHYNAYKFSCVDKNTMQQIANRYNLNVEILNYCLEGK